MRDFEAKVVRAVAAESGLAHGLLGRLIDIERSPVGRSGVRGINTQVAALIEKASKGGGRLAAVPSSTPAAEVPRLASEAADPGAAGLDDVSITRLILHNFLQFCDAELRPETTAARPLCLITGRNGYGKTGLVSAVHWALHGRVPEWARAEEGRLVHHGAPGPTARVEVTLELSSAFDGSIAIRRFRGFRRRGAGWTLSDKGEVTVRLGATGRILRADEARVWLRHRFPPEVLSYFAFDAESTVVQELSGQAGEQLPDISGVVEAALDVSPLRKMQERCRKRAGHYQRERHEGDDRRTGADIEAEIARVDASIDAAERELEGLTDRIGQLAEEQRTLRAQWSSLEKRIDPERQQHKEALRRRLAATKGDLERVRHRVAEVCHEALPILLLERAAARWSAEGAEGSPEDRSAPRLSGMREACARVAAAAVEGRIPWREHPMPAVEEITARLEELLGLRATPPERAEPMSSAGEKAAAATWRARLSVLAETARRKLPSPALPGRLAELEAQKAEIETELAEFEPTSLAPGWKDELAKKRDRLEEVAAELGRCRQQEQALKSRLEDLGSERKALEASLEPARAHDREREILRARESLATKLAAALGKITRRIRASRIEVLERAATDMLRRTAHKSEFFEKLDIDRETLRYRLLDAGGEPVPPGRSTGERTVLALCLVSGLQKASGCRFPLVLEAPLKPLDPDHQEAVIRHFLTRYPGQTLLLVKPGEIPEPYMPLCADRLSRTLRLIRPDPAREWTRIAADRAPSAAEAG